MTSVVPDWTLPRLPFFEPSHYALAERLASWEAPPDEHGPDGDLGPVCRRILADLAQRGLLDYVVPVADGDTPVRFDVRAICIIREALSYRSVLADTAFVMQGLGTAPLRLHPDAALRDGILDRCRSGARIAALAITEPESGSDVASIRTEAARSGDEFVLNGAKSWISNAGIADQYVVVVRTGEAPGARGLSTLLVEAGTPGLEAGPQRDMVAAHPIGDVRFTGCRVPAGNLISGAGEGFRAAMATFDVFRPTVGAAATGVARRALAETVVRMGSRELFGRSMARMEAVQAKVADMVVDTEAAALAVYRAAWMADVVGGRVTREASLAKLTATEAAFRVVDTAVQLFGALGVCNESVVGRLYREIRAMRIYEGASEVQKMVIARATLGRAATEGGR